MLPKDESLTQVDDVDFMSNEDVIIKWLTNNGFRPYIDESGSYKAHLSEHKLNIDVYDHRYSFFIMVVLMSWQEYEEADKTAVHEVINEMNINLLGTSIKAWGVGPVFSLWLNNIFESQTSMTFALEEQLDQLASAAERWKLLWRKKQQTS